MVLRLRWEWHYKIHFLNHEGKNWDINATLSVKKYPAANIWTAAMEGKETIFNGVWFSGGIGRDYIYEYICVELELDLRWRWFHEIPARALKFYYYILNTIHILSFIYTICFPVPPKTLEEFICVQDNNAGTVFSCVFKIILLWGTMFTSGTGVTIDEMLGWERYKQQDASSGILTICTSN